MSNFWANSDAGRHGIPGAVMSEGERVKWEVAQDLIRARTRIAELEGRLDLIAALCRAKRDSMSPTVLRALVDDIHDATGDTK